MFSYEAPHHVKHSTVSHSPLEISRVVRKSLLIVSTPIEKVTSFFIQQTQCLSLIILYADVCTGSHCKIVCVTDFLALLLVIADCIGTV